MVEFIFLILFYQCCRSKQDAVSEISDQGTLLPFQGFSIEKKSHFRNALLLFRNENR